MNIPTKEECLRILNKNKTPSNVIEHSKIVCKVAEEVSDKLIKKRVKVNKKLVVAAALLHDIERIKGNHAITGASLIKKLGYPEVAEVMVKHTLHEVEKEEKRPKTIEQKIVFYADKRAKGSEIVSLEERYRDLKERYNIDLSGELELSKRIEEELNP